MVDKGELTVSSPNEILEKLPRYCLIDIANENKTYIESDIAMQVRMMQQASSIYKPS